MRAGDPAPPYPPAAFFSDAMSYMCNANLMPFWHRNLPTQHFPGRPSAIAILNAPAQVVLVTEGIGYIPGTGGDDCMSECRMLEDGFPNLNPVIGNPVNYCAARYRHNGGSIYTLADGHVKWFKGPGASWRDMGTTGVAWRKSIMPMAAAWFRED